MDEPEDISIENVLALYQEGGQDLLTEHEAEVLATMFPEKGNKDDHNANLAAHISSGDLRNIAQEVIQWVDEDERSREDWKNREVIGIRLLGVSENTEGGATFKGASRVVHPLLMEACTQFQARAIAELWPSGGPVKTVVMGTPTEEKIEQARRVEGYMNYQYMNLMPGAFDEEDKLLFRLALSGSCFKKLYWDAQAGQLVSKFIEPDDFVVPYSASCLQTAVRYTHVIRYSPNEVKRLQLMGYYRDIQLADPNEKNDYYRKVIDEIDVTDGKTESHYQEDQRHTLYETHAEIDLKGFEDMKDGKPTGLALPYIITVDRDTQEVLSIRRNWKEGDTHKRKRVYFVHKKYLPGLGFYGFGLYHAIGGLSRTSTGALRALLDAAAFANMQGGYKSKMGRKVNGGDVPLYPGEWRDTEASPDELRNSFFPVPYKEPSDTLFRLLGYLDDIGRRFASTTENMVGEANNNGPVGTTLALIEQGSKVFSAIHLRLHQANAQEFKLLSDLNGEYLPEQYPYDIEGDSRFILKADFDSRVDVIPVSDPNIISGTQRITQAQSALELARQFPQYFDLREALRRMLEAMRVQAIDELMPEEDDIEPMDPVTENAYLTRGQPVKAFPEQDHKAHIIVLDAWFDRLDEKTKNAMEAPYMAHRAEHVALAYLVDMQRMTGFDFSQVPAELQQQATMAAAVVSQQMTTAADPTQAKIDRQDQETQARIQRDDMKVIADIKRKDSEAAAKLEQEYRKEVEKAEKEAAMTEAYLNG